MENNVREVRTIAKEARDNGAYKCAPRELALAESHIEFAERELDQGDYFRARDHLHVADDNAREAYRLSPRDKCVAPTRAAGDRDDDGILDDVDKCPTEPEDKDGFEDDDGCPDPDNDKDGIPDTDRQVPERARGQGRVRGRRRLPRSGQRHRRHPRRRPTSARTSPRTRTASRTTTAAPIPTTTRTASSTPTTSARTMPGPPDNDGCPKKYEHIVVTQEKIELKQKIFFDTNKATIQPRSFALLDEIASVLQVARRR